MTEKSYFHNGAWQGDAVLAPYGASVFGHLINTVRASDAVFNFFDVGTGLYDNFSTTEHSPNNMTVDVGDGNAFVDGVYCSSSATTLTIPSNSSGLPRMDRIVLRVNWVTQTVELSIKTGAPNIVPVPPALVQDTGVLYELSLARIYVPSGTTIIRQWLIIDEREFFEDAQHHNDYADDNIMHNSEFIAAVGTGATGGPAMWEVNTPASVALTRTDRFEEQARGTTVHATISAAHPAGLHTVLRITNQTTIMVTIKLLVEVISGELWIDVAGAGSGVNGVIVPPTIGPVEVILRHDFTAADPGLELYFSRYSSANVEFKLGQVTVAYGFVGTAFKPKHETILFGKRISFREDGAYSSSPQVETFAFNEIGPGATAYFMYLKGYDSASAGNANVFTSLQDNLYSANMIRIELGNYPNNSIRANQGLIFAEKDSADNYNEKIKVAYATVGSLFQTISVIGLQT